MDFTDKKQLETIHQYTQRKGKENKRSKLYFIIAVICFVLFFSFLFVRACAFDTYYQAL